MFYDNELTKGTVRVVNTQETDALSTSHLHLTTTGFTLAQRKQKSGLFLTLVSAPFTEIKLGIVI